jgi:alkanesulfonate monooxygenase SsuD/methylene tetrahydromethanopterin reductase-like flavin-dependent oxidoreductase (luciferase family)
MRFGTFLFTHAGPKGRDHEFIKETLAEARAAEDNGMDAVWLAEHHFDGTLAYVDPVSFASALAIHTKRVKIGTAVVQAALHHPIRVAEQLSLIDHLSEGRLIAGFGKGTMYNPYEYAAFGVPQEIAAERFDELEEIVLKCWSGERVSHKGKFFEFDIPMMRPVPFTKPHPQLLRACGNDGAAAAQGRLARPFLMAGTNEQVAKRVAAYRDAARDAGQSEAAVARALDQSWCWKNVVIADTDAAAENIAVDSFQATLAYRESLGMASRYVDQYKASGVRVPPGYVYGTPDTVIAKLSAMRETGMGGMIVRFRHGPMTLAQAVHSMEMFVHHVAPALNAPAAAAAQ